MRRAPDAERPPVTAPARCDYPRCGRPRHGTRWCKSHAARAAAGDIDRPIKSRAPVRPRKCRRRGCKAAAAARALCARHYQAARRAGDLPPKT